MMNRFWWLSVFLAPFMFRMAEGGAAPAGDGGAPAGGAPPVVSNGGGEDRSWLGEYAKDTGFDKFKTSADLAKAYKSGAEKWGAPQELIRLPKADADPAMWDSVYKQLGRPDTPDKYELKGPEGLKINPKMESVARAAFHKNGVSAKAAAEIFKEIVGGEKAEYDAIIAERKTQQATTETTFKSKWGEKYPEEMKGAVTVFGKLFTPALQKKFTAAGFDSDPDMVSAMHALSKTISFNEDKMLSGNGGGQSNRDLATVESEINATMTKMAAMKDRLHPEYGAQKELLDKLMNEGTELKHGSKS